MFNPSKTVALWLAIAWVTLSVISYAAQVAFCGGVFTLLALFYGGIWLYKLQRDQRLIDAARVSDVPQLLEIPSMTSKGSSRLFVPPPLDKGQ